MGVLRGREHGCVVRQRAWVCREVESMDVSWQPSTYLVLRLQVDPELEANVVSIGGWHLSVHDSPASCHPLQVSGMNGASVPTEILVLECSFQHVGHLKNTRVFALATAVKFTTHSGVKILDRLC